jgi:hypothetical protein
MDFWRVWVHAVAMPRVLARLLDRRRERQLARELELRWRRQIDERAQAAARIADDMHRS